MSILKTILSIGSGILAAAACYVFMSSKKREGNEDSSAPMSEDHPQVNNMNKNDVNADKGQIRPISVNSDNLLKKLDKFQVGLINFARFVSEVVRAISLFIRATRCYEYDVSYSN